MGEYIQASVLDTSPGESTELSIVNRERRTPNWLPVGEWRERCDGGSRLFGFTARQLKFLLSYGLFNIFRGMLVLIAGPFYPPEAEERGISTSTVGFVFSSYDVATFVVVLAYGKYLIPKLGPQWVIILSTFNTTACAILFGCLGFIENRTLFVVWSFVVRLLAGAGDAGFYPSAFTIFAHEFPDIVATTVGTFELFFGVGAILGPIVCAPLINAVGFAGTYFVVGFGLLLCSLVILFVAPRKTTTFFIESANSKNILERIQNAPKPDVQLPTTYFLQKQVEAALEATGQEYDSARVLEFLKSFSVIVNRPSEGVAPRVGQQEYGGFSERAQFAITSAALTGQTGTISLQRERLPPGYVKFGIVDCEKVQVPTSQNVEQEQASTTSGTIFDCMTAPVSASQGHQTAEATEQSASQIGTVTIHNATGGATAGSEPEISEDVKQAYEELIKEMSGIMTPAYPTTSAGPPRPPPRTNLKAPLAPPTDQHVIPFHQATLIRTTPLHSAPATPQRRGRQGGSLVTNIDDVNQAYDNVIRGIINKFSENGTPMIIQSVQNDDANKAAPEQAKVSSVQKKSTKAARAQLPGIDKEEGVVESEPDKSSIASRQSVEEAQGEQLYHENVIAKFNVTFTNNHGKDEQLNSEGVGSITGEARDENNQVIGTCVITASQLEPTESHEGHASYEQIIAHSFLDQSSVSEGNALSVNNDVAVAPATQSTGHYSSVVEQAYVDLILKLTNAGRTEAERAEQQKNEDAITPAADLPRIENSPTEEYKEFLKAMPGCSKSVRIPRHAIPREIASTSYSAPVSAPINAFANGREEPPSFLLQPPGSKSPKCNYSVRVSVPTKRVHFEKVPVTSSQSMATLSTSAGSVPNRSLFEEQWVPKSPPTSFQTMDAIAEEERPVFGFIQLLKLPSIYFAILSLFATAASIGFITGTLEAHLEQFNLNTIGVGGIFSVNTGVYTLSSPLWGVISDKFGSGSKKAVIIACGSFLVAIGFIFVGPLDFVTTENNVWITLLGLCLHGIGIGAAVMIFFPYATESAIVHGAPDNIATQALISSLFTLTFSFGNAFGPAVSGVLYDAVGFKDASLVVIALSSLVIVAAVVVLAFTKGWKAPAKVEVQEESNQRNGNSIPLREVAIHSGGVFNDD